MYCQFCGTPRAQELSYCNRCGADLRERKGSPSTAAISAMLTSITMLGVGGLGVMLAGALVLKKAGLSQELIGVFMLFTFLIVSVTEVMLVKNLAKLTSASENKNHLLPAPPMHQEMRLPPASSLGEPVPSVVENTTRTLDYVQRER